jgi:hypothetical protein
MPEARWFSLKGIGILVAGLALGAAIGLAIANTSTTIDAPEVSVTGMALDDFIRLNTTAYDGLAPVVSAVVVEPRAVDPGFFEVNVGSFNGLAPEVSASAADPTFVEINTASLEYPVASAVVVDAHFLEANVISLEYPGRGYIEPSSRLR